MSTEVGEFFADRRDIDRLNTAFSLASCPRHKRTPLLLLRTIAIAAIGHVTSTTPVAAAAPATAVTPSLRLPILAEIHFFLNGLAYDGEYYMNEVVKVAGQLILPESTHTIPY